MKTAKIYEAIARIREYHDDEGWILKLAAHCLGVGNERALKDKDADLGVPGKWHHFCRRKASIDWQCDRSGFVRAQVRENTFEPCII